MFYDLTKREVFYLGKINELLLHGIIFILIYIFQQVNDSFPAKSYLLTMDRDLYPAK